MKFFIACLAFALGGFANAKTLGPEWIKIAEEGGSYSLKYKRIVNYGANGKFKEKTFVGPFKCDNATFGDPIFGVAKACYAKSPTPLVVVPPPPPPPQPEKPPVDPVVGDIVNTDGSINTANWDAMYAAAGTDAWIDYTRGKAATGVGGVNLYERPHYTIKAGGTQNAGQIGSVYEHGQADGSDGGAYSTSQADIVTFGATAGSGVVSLQTSGYTNNTGQLKPQPQWQRGWETEHYNFGSYRASGLLPAGNVKPMFVASSNDISSDNGTSRLIGTADGVIVGVGSNTAANRVSVKLAPNKLPVAGAMTNKAEFLFVTVWDKVARKGQVAVLIAAGLAEGVPWTDTALAYRWWEEWREAYPGLPNQGNTGFLKVLGYVDIPGMSAPTSVAVNTGMHPWQMLGGDARSIGYANSPIKDHYLALRDGGGDGGRIARGGLLAVGSKSEKKVVYFDLKPLFSWVYDSYYGNNHTRGERQNLGLADAQWPQTMALSGVTLPVVKTVAFADEVAAVKFTGTRPAPQNPGEPFSWVVTNSAAGQGSVHVLSVGGCVPGTANNRSCAAGDIAERSVVGGLPYVSSIATMLGMKRTGNVDLNTGFWFVSRPGRDVGFVRLNSNGSGGAVGLQYKTSIEQCADPVGLADIDNYSNESNAQLLMCYNDRKVATYRTDTLFHNGSWSAWPQSTPVQGTAGVAAEYYGSFPTSGKPVHALTANVP